MRSSAGYGRRENRPAAEVEADALVPVNRDELRCSVAMTGRHRPLAHVSARYSQPRLTSMVLETLATPAGKLQAQVS